MDEDAILKDCKADATVKISAKQKIGLDGLLQVIEELLKEQKVYIERIFDYKDAGIIQRIRKYGQLLEESYREDGILVKAYLPKDLYNQLG